MAFKSFRASSKALVWLLMVTLVIGLGSNGFDPRVLAHALDHANEAPAAFSDGHEHTLRLVASVDGETTPLESAEHQYLHSACHGQPLLTSSLLAGIGQPSAPEAHLLPHVLTPPPVALEPLFRPPRKIIRT